MLDGSGNCLQNCYTRVKNTLFSCISPIHLIYYGMLNPKTNVCKLRHGVLLSLFACFQDGGQNHTESYIVVDSLFNVPRNICEGSVLVFVLLCISLCSLYFC